MLTLSGKYEYRDEFARHYHAEGREQGAPEGHDAGRLEAARGLVGIMAERHGALESAEHEGVTGCAELELLRRLAVDLAAATDRATVTAMLRQRIDACDHLHHLYALAVAIASAGDLPAVERLLARRLPPLA